MSNLLIREWLNGGLIPLNLCIMFMLGYQIYRASKVGRGWMRRDGVKSAIALWWIFLADLIRASLAWYMLHMQSMYGRFPYLGPVPTFLYSVAAAILMIATLRLIHVLSPASWKHRGWLVAALFCSVFLLALEMMN